MSTDNPTQTTFWQTGEPLKRCTRCGAVKPVSEFYFKRQRGQRRHPTCKPCMLAYHKSRRDAYFQEHGRNPPRDFRPRNLKTNYGLTQEDFDRMMAKQGGVCAVCRQPPNSERFKYLSVDHDHGTGKVRELLCTRCNMMIGQAKENPAVLIAAAEYLRKHQSD